MYVCIHLYRERERHTHTHRHTQIILLRYTDTQTHTYIMCVCVREREDIHTYHIRTRHCTYVHTCSMHAYIHIEVPTATLSCAECHSSMYQPAFHIWSNKAELSGAGIAQKTETTRPCCAGRCTSHTDEDERRGDVCMWLGGRISCVQQSSLQLRAFRVRPCFCRGGRGHW